MRRKLVVFRPNQKTRTQASWVEPRYEVNETAQKAETYVVSSSRVRDVKATTDLLASSTSKPFVLASLIKPFVGLDVEISETN